VRVLPVRVENAKCVAVSTCSGKMRKTLTFALGAPSKPNQFIEVNKNENPETISQPK